MFFLCVGIVAAFRVEGDVHYAKTHGIVTDFGFYANGTLDVAVRTKDQQLINRNVRVYLFDTEEYNEWVQSTWDEPWERCPENVSRAAGNWTVALASTDQSAQFVAPESRVYQVIVVHCEDLSKGNPVYHIRAQFVNPDGQHLDSRVIPYQKVLYGDIAAFVLVGVVFVLLLVIRFVCMHGRGFLALHVVISVIPLFFVCVCVLKVFSMRRQAETDDKDALGYVYTVFSCLADILLFSIMVVAATGWCVLNIHLKVWKVLLWTLAIGVFMSGYYIRMNVAMTLVWQIVVVALQMLSLMFVMWETLENVRNAKQHVKAHLLVIQGTGVDPRTTPIFNKWKFFSRFIYIVATISLTYLAVTMMFAFLNAPAWISMLAKDVLQLLIITTFMVLYRPRYAAIDDEYMRRDGDSTAEREAVTLEDLDNYDIAHDNAMRIWREGEALPLEPVLVSSAANIPLAYRPYRTIASSSHD